MELFDICILTASSPRQAENFERLLRRRHQFGLYPREIEFRVYSDPTGGNPGSGGATLAALHRLCLDLRVSNPEAFFATHRILVIHAGGGKRRLPCYAPEGRPFMPLPVESSSVVPPVLLDLQLGLFLKYPWKTGELCVASGDVVADFDPGSLRTDRSGICGFAKPATPEAGSTHGVFRFDANRKRILDFYQKADPAKLRREALLEGTGDCALDMGIFSFDPGAAAAFLELGGRPGPASKNLTTDLLAGRASLNLYLEILSAAIPDLASRDYLSRVAGRSQLPRKTLQDVYSIFHPHPMNGDLPAAPLFLHFGSLAGFPSACRELLQREIRPFYLQGYGELRPRPSAIIEANCHHTSIYGLSGRSTLVENCRDLKVGTVMGDNLLLGLRDLNLEVELPAHLCLDQRRHDGRDLCLVYSTRDTFSPATRAEDLVFCGMKLPQWLDERGLVLRDVLPTGVFDLQQARLFHLPAGDPRLRGYWQIPAGAEWGREFRQARRVSLEALNAAADPLAREAERMENRKLALAELVLAGTGWRNMSALDFVAIFRHRKDSARLRKLMQGTDDPLLQLYRNSLLNSLAPRQARGAAAAPPESIAFTSPTGGPPLQLAIKEDQIVWARSPVRFDLAGGWSDTPPYTLRAGGKVVNVAVDLNGQPPIQVFCRRTPELHLRIHSIDLGLTETVTSAARLLDYRNPVSPFALPKAALCLLGFAETRGAENLPGLLQRTLGCGLEITLLAAVPKGSGLGTSSILGATILGALHRALGRPVLLEELIRQVLQTEQMLTTGGGWQDQIGGMAGGVKYIESQPGLRPSPVVDQLDPFLFEDRRTAAGMVLFYTGCTRLAKNILQEVVADHNRMAPATLFTLEVVKRLALDARRAIARRDLPGLAHCVSGSWQANQRIHPGTSTPAVGRIMRAAAPHCLGAKLLGAGGGGYALFLCSTPTRADGLKELLQKRFEDDRARLVDFALNPHGLTVSVS